MLRSFVTGFRYILLTASASLLMACTSSAPLIQVPQHLFHDEAFAAPKTASNAGSIFAASPEMKQFIAKEIVQHMRIGSHQRALFNALYTKAQLKLEYDSSYTRNAAETFNARSGNCLSLVIMTAALAKEMGLEVSYQNVTIPENWSRTGALYFNVGHVNIVLGKRHFDKRIQFDKNDQMTIDFYPPEDTAGQRTTELEEQTVIAMYFNNRAAESMAAGDLNQAYHWARASITAAPNFAAAYNTLGVIYLRHSKDEFAYQALSRALELDPDSKVAMSNIIQALEQTDRHEQAVAMQEKLIKLQPYPPFHFFKLGVKAMEEKDYLAAKRWFNRELDRSPDYHEFHFWIGLANLRLGEIKMAEQHFTKAKSNSTSEREHTIYSAKLDQINAIKTKIR